jgi:hypothetical protein
LDNLSEKNENKSGTKAKNSLKFLDRIIMIVFISTFIFTGAMIVFSWFKGWEMTTLTERWFTVMVGELLIAGLIQIVKNITNKNKKEIDDEY